MAAPPSNHLVLASQFTQHVHRKEYPAINPSLPKNSQAGKVVIITGASQGLGREAFVPAFANANVKAIVLVARNASALSDTAEVVRRINPKIHVLTVATDITDSASVDNLFEKVKATFGTADILVNNSGLMGDLGPIRDIAVNTWWRDFEVNVKGTFLVTQAFLMLVGTTKAATIIHVSTGAALGIVPGVSAYSISKLANIQLGAYVAAENTNVTSITIHPGVIKTAMVPETSPFRPFAEDEASLSGGLAVWLSTEEASFLNGRYVNANWDVQDLVAKKEEIVENNELVLVLKGKFGAAQFK